MTRLVRVLPLLFALLAWDCSRIIYLNSFTPSAPVGGWQLTDRFWQQRYSYVDSAVTFAIHVTFTGFDYPVSIGPSPLPIFPLLHFSEDAQRVVYLTVEVPGSTDSSELRLDLVRLALDTTLIVKPTLGPFRSRDEEMHITLSFETVSNSTRTFRFTFDGALGDGLPTPPPLEFTRLFVYKYEMFWAGN